MAKAHPKDRIDQRLKNHHHVVAGFQATGLRPRCDLIGGHGHCPNPPLAAKEVFKRQQIARQQGRFVIAKVLVLGLSQFRISHPRHIERVVITAKQVVRAVLLHPVFSPAPARRTLAPRAPAHLIQRHLIARTQLRCGGKPKGGGKPRRPGP